MNIREAYQKYTKDLTEKEKEMIMNPRIEVSKEHIVLQGDYKGLILLLVRIIDNIVDSGVKDVTDILHDIIYYYEDYQKFKKDSK